LHGRKPRDEVRAQLACARSAHDYQPFNETLRQSPRMN
jgi:hypothetical protein